MNPTNTKSKTERIVITILIGIVLIGGIFYFNRNNSILHKTGDVTNYNPLPGAGFLTDTGVLCKPTSTLLLATSSAGRPYVAISNVSSSTISLGMNSAGTSSPYMGMTVFASSTVILSQISNYLGAIYCTSLGSVASTSISAVN